MSLSFQPIQKTLKATGSQGPKDQQLTVESTPSLEIFNMEMPKEVSQRKPGNFPPDIPRQLKKEPEKAKSQQEEKERSEVLRQQPYATIPELMVVFNTVPLRKFEMDPLVITTGNIGRIYPERIIPWDSFESRQQETWDILSTSSNYSARLFSPVAQLQNKVARNLGETFTANINYTVLRPVLTVLRDFFRTGELRQQLQFPDYAIGIDFLRDFENLHDSKVSKTDPTRQKVFDDNDVCNLCGLASKSTRGIPICRIDYMSPLTLSAAEILYELQGGEFISTRDLIKRKGNDIRYDSQRQVLAVVTHLFSSMIKTAVQYGFVLTGEAIIFLYISDDPSQVEYHVCNSRDLSLNEPASMHKTPIAKIIAFCIQAVAAKPPPQEWHDAAAKLDTWAVDYDDVVQSVPKGSQEWWDTPDDGTSQSTTLTSHRSKSDIRPLNNAKKGNGSEKRVHERDYCSAACLLGLANGGDLDPKCPNNADHGQSHLEHCEFLSLLQEQLAHDRGRVTDCEPLWIDGNCGAMFKITLTSHGYTVFAKGVELENAPHLTREAEVYRHLHSIQGIHIPVCLGNVDLLLPYHHWGTEYVRFLLQSYAGVPVWETINLLNKWDILHKANDAMKAIHRLGVLHTHPDIKSIMTKHNTDGAFGFAVQIIDFARAEIRSEEEEVGERKRKRQRLSSKSTIEAADTSFADIAFAEILAVKRALRNWLIREQLKEDRMLLLQRHS